MVMTGKFLCLADGDLMIVYKTFGVSPITLNIIEIDDLIQNSDGLLMRISFFKILELF